MAGDLRQYLNEAIAAAENARKQLFNASQLASQSADVEWTTVERLFAAIKSAEFLRREIQEILNPDEAIRLRRISPSESLLRKKQEEYPKFFLRDDEAIVRVGLGQEGNEYEHVVKRQEFERIVSVLNSFVEAPGFSVDEVLKQLNLPSYLTYLVVSLLRDRLDLIESPKRGRYKFRDNGKLDVAAILAVMRSESNEEEIKGSA
jgi:hypothetical protein